MVALGLGIVFAGYVIVVRPIEAQIANRYAALAAAQQTIDHYPALSEHLALADRERNRLRRALARFRLGAGPATTLERFLQTASVATMRHGTTIRAIDAEPHATQLLAAVPPPPLDELPLRLTLRGAYGALLATIRDLISAPLASRLTIEALAPDDRERARPALLVAELRVVLLRSPEKPGVRTEPH